MKSSLKNMVLVLFTITFVSALLVGAVDMVTKDTIALTEQQTKNDAKFAVLNTTADKAVVEADSLYNISGLSVVVSKVVDKADNTKVLGYAVEAPSITKTGYGGRITLMVGFVEEQSGQATINGIEVLQMNETPGLGANMTKEGNSLERSAVGKDPAQLNYAVSKEGGSFDALTGSTISSRAYANAVETAYAGYLKATNQLDESKVKGATAMSGASNTQVKEPATQAKETTNEEETTAVSEPVDVEGPEAQKGEISNE